MNQRRVNYPSIRDIRSKVPQATRASGNKELDESGVPPTTAPHHELNHGEADPHTHRSGERHDKDTKVARVEHTVSKLCESDPAQQSGWHSETDDRVGHVVVGLIAATVNHRDDGVRTIGTTR